MQFISNWNIDRANKEHFMNRYLKMELMRSFKNRRMILAVAFGLGLSVWHYAAYIFPLRNYIFSGDYPLSAYNKWLGGECFSLQSSLFYMLIPMACALPYGESWLYDCTSSIGGQEIIRGSQKSLVRTKILVSFLTGAVLAVLPLVFDFALTCTTLPAIIPKVSLGLSPIGTDALLGELFYAHPLGYTLIYIGINGLFFGLLNTFSLVSRLFTRNRYMAVLAPYLYYMAFHCAGTTMRRFAWCPSGFLRPCQPFVTTWAILWGEMALMLGISIWAARKFIREEHGLL
jgi:hypothetical protein